MSSAPPSRTTGTPAVNSGTVLFGTAFLAVLASASQTLVVPILSQMPEIFNTSASNAAWVVTATPLASAVAIPVIGRLGDLFGKHRMLVFCAFPLIIGSIICAISTSLPMMILGRAVQGLSMGIIPLGIALLRGAIPPEKVASAMAVMSASLGVGSALGLPFAAAVAQYGSWRLMFWTVAGLAVLGLIFLILLVPKDVTPDSGDGGHPPFDYVGAVLLGSGLVCFLLPVSKGSDWGWGSLLTLGFFLAAVILLALWGRAELRHPAPLVDLHTLARPTVLRTDIASALIMAANYVVFLSFPQILQLPGASGYGLGQSMVAMALWIMPSGLTMLAISPFTAKLAARFGPRMVLIISSLFVTVAYILAIPLVTHAWGVMVAGVLIHIGVGLTLGVIPTLLMSDAPVEQTAAVNSFNTVCRNIGTAVSGAVTGMVLAQMTVGFGGQTIPSESGFHTIFIIGGVTALISALVGLTIPKKVSPSHSVRVVEESSDGGDYTLAADGK